MDKPVEPQLGDYGLTNAEITAFETSEQQCDSVITNVGVPTAIITALAVAVIAITKIKDDDIASFVFIWGALLAGGVVYGICETAVRALYRHRFRYRHKIQLYRQACKDYQAALRDYEQWQRCQEAILRRQKEAFWLSLSGEGFEIELTMLYGKLGYNAFLTCASNDKGIDIILKRDGQTKVVQCKRHNGPVGPAVARELYGAMISYGADTAVLASTGGFTKGVYDFVANKPIELVGLDEILEMQGKTDNAGFF